MEKRQNNYGKQISIPLYIPVLIVITAIIISNKWNPIPTVEASSEQCAVETEPVHEVKDEETKPSIPAKEVEKEPVQVKEPEKPEKTDVIETTNTTNAINSTYTVNGVQYNIVGILNIPSLGIEYPILSETTEKLLKISLTKYWGANPNQVGNMVILGHNFKNGKFFANLSKINLGDIVKITDLTGKTVNYEVYDTYTIEPDDNSCTSQLTNGETEITLITCYYVNGSSHATKRFVVKARADI